MSNQSTREKRAEVAHEGLLPENLEMAAPVHRQDDLAWGLRDLVAK